MNSAHIEIVVDLLSNYKWRWRCNSPDVWIHVNGRSYNGHAVSVFQLLLLLNIKSAKHIGPDIQLNVVI